MSEIDCTQPLELSDGTPVELDMNPDHFGFAEGWINVKWGDPENPHTRNFLIADGSIRVPGVWPEDYRTLRNVQPETITLPKSLWERTEALVRRLAGSPAGLLEWHADSAVRMEAVAVAKLLPEPPVDPDLIEARAIAGGKLPGEADYFNKGECDQGDYVQIALAAIARGRQLEREGK